METFTQAVNRAEREAADITEISLNNAHKAITEAAPLMELIEGYEIDLSSEIARIMRNLDDACLNRQIARDAVLSACSQMQAKLIAASRRNEGIEE